MILPRAVQIHVDCSLDIAAAYTLKGIDGRCGSVVADKGLENGWIKASGLCNVGSVFVVFRKCINFVWARGIGGERSILRQGLVGEEASLLVWSLVHV